MLRRFIILQAIGLTIVSSVWADAPVLPSPSVLPPLGPSMGPVPAPLAPNLGWANFPGNALIPGSPYAPSPGGYVPPPPVPAPGMGCPCLNRHGLGCWAHHDQFGCSSLHSTLVFQFGSCRAFFGETCRQESPPLPIPNGIGFRSVYPPR